MVTIAQLQSILMQIIIIYIIHVYTLYMTLHVHMHLEVLHIMHVRRMQIFYAW